MFLLTGNNLAAKQTVLEPTRLEKSIFSNKYLYKNGHNFFFAL